PVSVLAVDAAEGAGVHAGRILRSDEGFGDDVSHSKPLLLRPDCRRFRPSVAGLYLQEPLRKRRGESSGISAPSPKASRATSRAVQGASRMPLRKWPVAASTGQPGILPT